jgi:cell shape-determining protein MreC
MYENIIKLIDEAIKDKNLLLNAYKSSNEELEKENKKLREMLAMCTEKEGINNETN